MADRYKAVVLHLTNGETEEELEATLLPALRRFQGVRAVDLVDGFDYERMSGSKYRADRDTLADRLEELARNLRAEDH